jgi:hypothetical protein
MKLSAAVLLMIASIGPVSAQTPRPIDFEDLPADTIVTNQYGSRGVTFLEGIPFAGAARYLLPVIRQVALGMDLTFPSGAHLHTHPEAHSGMKVADISTCTQGMACEFFAPAAGGRFSTPVRDVRVFVGALPGGAGTANVALKAFGADHQVLGTATATVTPGNGINTQLIVTAGGIVFFEVSGTANSTMRLAIDDLSFDTPPTLQPPDFALSGPPVITLRQGGSANATIDVGRLNGSSGIVSFNAAGLPLGVTAHFVPRRSHPGSGPERVTLTLSATPDAPLTGPHPAGAFIVGSPTDLSFGSLTGSPTVTPTGAGPGPRQLPIGVLVTAGFSLSLAGTSDVSVPPCGQVDVPLMIVRDPTFSGLVTLTVDGLPADVSGTINPNPVPPAAGGAVANQVILTLTPRPLSAASANTVTVSSTSGALPTRQVSLQVHVASSLCCPEPGEVSTGRECHCKLPHGTNDPRDVASLGKLAYSGTIRVINIYWGGNNWNNIPGNQNFQKEDIERAMAALFKTNYFDALCQYSGPGGGPNLQLLPGVDTGQALNPCLPHVPQDNFTAADVFQFVSCEEGFSAVTDVPRANGIPTELLPGTGNTCSLCGITLMPCYLDGICLLTPNATGDLIINVIPPHNRHFFVTAGESCNDPQSVGYHFQVPSNALGYPLLPLAMTQGRPIYFTFNRTECFNDISELIHNITHEMVEAITDPQPGAFWWSSANGQTAKDGEIADVCSDTATFAWTDLNRMSQQAAVSSYWSNYHHQCIAPVSPR